MEKSDMTCVMVRREGTNTASFKPHIPFGYIAMIMYGFCFGSTVKK